MFLKTRLKWLFILIVVAFGISGCRYWSLYQFSQQFCEFDEQIEVQNKKGRVGLHLIDPVLPRQVFQRYLAATELQSHEREYELEDIYQIKSASDDRRYKIYAHYHTGSKTPRLIAGELDLALSALFPTHFVEPILRSFCSDDFDLSLKRLVARMKINNLPPAYTPTMQDFLTEFGRPFNEEKENGKTQITYQFHFVRQNSQVQTKPMTFTLRFNSAGTLGNMRVHYHKYDYTIDFELGEAKLIAIRRL